MTPADGGGSLDFHPQTRKYSPTLDLTAADIRPLLAAVVQMFEHSSARHRLLLTIPDEPVLVRCDQDHLRGVFENVVVSAVKYSPAGGNVDVTLRREGDDAVVRVRDYGIGISPAALPHIFERAYRAPEAEAIAMGNGTRAQHRR